MDDDVVTGPPSLYIAEHVLYKKKLPLQCCTIVCKSHMVIKESQLFLTCVIKIMSSRCVGPLLDNTENEWREKFH